MKLKISLFALFLLLAACGRPSRMPTADGLELQSSQSLSFESLNSAIFATKCAACHANFSTYSGMMSSGAIVGKSPEQSPLYQKVASGQMPKGGPPLSDAEVQAIYEWISAGAPQSVAGEVPGTGTLPGTQPPPATGGGSPAPGTGSGEPSPTFAWIQANILNTRCVICHRGATAPGGYDLSSYEGVLAGGRIVAGNPASSEMFQRVDTNSMPPGNPLTAEQKAIISQWIQNGAKNDAPVGGLPGGTPTDPPPLPPLEPKFNSIMANIIGPRCLSCHDSTQRKGGVVLQDYQSLMRQVVPRDAEASELYDVLEDNEMPASGGALTFQQKETIRQWINQGALNN